MVSRPTQPDDDVHTLGGPVRPGRGWADEGVDLGEDDRLVGLGVVAAAEVVAIVEGPLLQRREHHRERPLDGDPAESGRAGVDHVAGRDAVVGVVVVVRGQGDLLEIVRALHPPRRLAGRLHGGQQQCDQDADDGDDHEQLDEREGSTTGHGDGSVLMDAREREATRRRRPRGLGPHRPGNGTRVDVLTGPRDARGSCGRGRGDEAWVSAGSQAGASIRGGRSSRDDRREGGDVHERAAMRRPALGPPGEGGRMSEATWPTGPAERAVGRPASSHGAELRQGEGANSVATGRVSSVGVGLGAESRSDFFRPQQHESPRQVEHWQTRACSSASKLGVDEEADAIPPGRRPSSTRAATRSGRHGRGRRALSGRGLTRAGLDAGQGRMPARDHRREGPPRRQGPAASRRFLPEIIPCTSD